MKFRWFAFLSVLAGAFGFWSGLVNGSEPSVPVLVNSALALPTEAEPVDDSGCLGQCGNNYSSVSGWCGNCATHCEGGTEAECTAGCNARCDEVKRQNDWEAECRKANDYGECDRGCAQAKKDGNKAAEGHFCSNDGGCRTGKRAAQGHWCSDSGDGKKGALAAIGDACAGNSWSGCLAKCGGIKGCREEWCEGDAPKREQCYDDADAARDACENTCRQGRPKCKDEHCAGFLMMSTCDGKKKVTGFCASWTFKL